MSFAHYLVPQIDCLSMKITLLLLPLHLVSATDVKYYYSLMHLVGKGQGRCLPVDLWFISGMQWLIQFSLSLFLL